jgi:hypothetical protein
MNMNKSEAFAPPPWPTSTIREGVISHTLPHQVRAGEPVCWSATIQPGRALARGAEIALARRWPSDWGCPQWTHPEGTNYVRATATNGAGIALRNAQRGDWHPNDHVLMLTIEDSLPASDSITVSFGGGGSPGALAQTFAENDSVLSVRLHEAGNASWQELGQITTNVVGSDAARLVAIGPSIVARGEPFALSVRIEDEWGNPASDVDLEIVAGPFGHGARLTSDAGSAVRIEMTLDDLGAHRLDVRDADGRFTAISNPIECVAERRSMLVWGDLHAQSAIGCGAQTIAEYFRFARDFAAIDFASHQGNCFLISRAEWAETEDVTAACNEDGRFVALLGYEWSGATEIGGDRNVYFPAKTGELRRSSHKHLADLSDVGTDLPHVRDLHDHVRETNTLMAVHVGGRTTNLDWHEPTTERLLEVHSTHATSEWFLFDALRRGYRLGLTGGSDGVDGRPGASRPGRRSVRNLSGGLTAVAVPALTRDGVWSGLWNKRTYATTGERIILQFESDGRGLGETYATEAAPRMSVHVEGTAPLRSVEIFRGVDCVFTAPIAPADPAPSDRVRIAWRGAKAPGNWQRARLPWQGVLDVVGGSILEVLPYGRETGDVTIDRQSETCVAWTAITAGNWTGLELRLRETPATALRLTSGSMTIATAADALAAGPVMQSKHDPDQTIRVERLPRRPAPLSWAGTFTDTDAPPGDHLYWVRVQQDDGAFAWTSPIFVSCKRDREQEDDSPAGLG